MRKGRRTTLDFDDDDYEEERMKPVATSAGSYGYAVKCLAEGLQSAVDSGWITKEEARIEFRTHVYSVIQGDELRAEIKELEERLNELRGTANEA